MPHYQPYLGFWAFSRYHRKVLKRFMGSDDVYRHTLKDVALTAVASSETKDPRAAAELKLCALCDIVQAKHYLTSHVVYYVPENLANSLWHVDLDVRMEELKIPNSVFEINFPKGYRIPGTSKLMSPLLVGIHGKQTDTVFEKKFSEDLFQQHKVKVSLPDFLDITGLLVQRSDPTLDLKKTKQLKPFKLVELMNDPHIWRYNNVLIPDGKKCLSHMLKQFEIDQTHMYDRLSAYAAMIFAIKLLCYINLENPDMEQLLNAECNRPATDGNPPSVFLLGQNTPANAHMRRGHMRCLRHERYKRDEEGRPRIVWVNECMVNRQSKYDQLPPHGKLAGEVSLFGQT